MLFTYIAVLSKCFFYIYYRSAVLSRYTTCTNVKIMNSIQLCKKKENILC